MNQPLSGLKVIDFTQVMLGPCATQTPGDYGADAIKVERIGAGDLSRTSIDNDPGGMQNPVFCSLNRNKRSIALDLKSPAGLDVVRTLAKTADILRARIASNPTAHWIERLEALDLLCSPVRNLGAAPADPQTAINGMIVRAPGETETLDVVGSPVHLSDDGFALRHNPPKLGFHGTEILAEHGYDQPTIERLRATGVLARPDLPTFFISAPTQNARSPAPVSTTARTSRSASSWVQMASSAASVGS